MFARIPAPKHQPPCLGDANQRTACIGQLPMPPSARSSLPKGLSETLTVVAKTLIITAKISISAQKKEAGASFPDIDIIFFFCAFSSLSLSGISASP